jgi:hypothetical protein
MKVNKKCKNCKQPMSIIYNSLQKYCVDKPECVEVWVASEKEKQWKKRKAKLKQEAMTLSDYMKIAQQVFNKYIRQRDEGQPCISCGKKINGVTHASHYKSQGGHSNVRFHELNVWSSCYKCNVELSGNLLSYRERLIEKIGLEKVTEIEKLSMIERKWSIEEVKEIIEKYKKLTK